MPSEHPPWIGLAPYTEELQAQFFGRERERESLLRLIEGDTLTVFFSASGLGKSSLLQAGVFPELRRRDYLPVYVRVTQAETAAPLSEQVLLALTGAAAAVGIEFPPIIAGDSLWEYFHRRTPGGGDCRFWTPTQRVATPVLVFDQFEELFTLGKQNAARIARGDELIDALAELIENRAPTRVTSALEEAESTTGKFEFGRVPLRVVFSLREDYLAHLEGLRGKLRSIRNNRMRLTPLRLSQARDAIEKPARPHDLLASRAADEILEFVSRSTSNTGVLGERPGLLGSGQHGVVNALAVDDSDEPQPVDPALLSMFCAELDGVRRAAHLPQITPELVASHRDRFLSGFYERVLEGIPSEVRDFVEAELVSPGGYRDSRGVDDALSRPGITQAALDTLVDRRLLRTEDRQAGPRRIELSHDLLCGMVRKSREERRLRVAKEDAERAQSVAETLAEDIRARFRKTVAFAMVLSLMLVVSILALVWAVRATQVAETARVAATRASEIANAQANNANTARKAALEQERLATLAREQAELASKQFAKSREMTKQLMAEGFASDDQLLQPTADVKFRGSRKATGENLFLFDVQPQDDSSVFPFEQVARITYKAFSSHKDNSQLILIGTRQTEFRFKYQGWGCYKRVLALVEWTSINRDPVFVKFDGCKI